MSSELERDFSGAKLTVSGQRNSLKGKTTELLECLKSWFWLGIFTEEDLHTVVNDLDEDGAAEALDWSRAMYIASARTSPRLQD